MIEDSMTFEMSRQDSVDPPTRPILKLKLPPARLMELSTPPPTEDPPKKAKMVRIDLYSIYHKLRTNHATGQVKFGSFLDRSRHTTTVGSPPGQSIMESNWHHHQQNRRRCATAMDAGKWPAYLDLLKHAHPSLDAARKTSG